MNSLRPDEKALASQQKRREENKGFLKKGVSTAIGLGAAAVGGAGLGLSGMSSIASKILPFLSENIPFDMAMKGLQKFSPAIAGMVEKGMKKGLNPRDGLNFIKDKLTSEEKAKEDRNVIQMESPELHSFMENEIKKGRSPIEAGAVAQLDKNFKRFIDKLTKDHKTPWSKLIEMVYGGKDSAKPQGSGILNEDTLSSFKPKDELMNRRAKGGVLNEDSLGIQPVNQAAQMKPNIQPSVAKDLGKSQTTTFGVPKGLKLGKESSDILNQFVKPVLSQDQAQPQQPQINPEMQALMGLLQQVQQRRQSRGQ